MSREDMENMFIDNRPKEGRPPPGAPEPGPLDEPIPEIEFPAPEPPKSHRRPRRTAPKRKSKEPGGLEWNTPAPRERSRVKAPEPVNDADWPKAPQTDHVWPDDSETPSEIQWNTPKRPKTSAAPAAAGRPLPRSDPDRIDPRALSRRFRRLRGSAIAYGVYSAPFLFVLITATLLVLDPKAGVSLGEHVNQAVGRGAFAGLVAGVAIAIVAWVAMFVLTVHSRSLVEHGRVVPVRRAGRPTIVGGWFALQAVAMALGALWGPLARLGRKVPILKVAYSFELDGKEYRVAELLSADEAVAMDDRCEAVASVDPERPLTRHFLYKASGPPQPAPQSSSLWD